MTNRSTTSPIPITGPRRCPRRTPRPLSLLAPVPDHRTAEAMDDEHAAEELMNDLLALVDAGLVTPIQREQGTVRYSPADSDDPAV